MNLAFHPEAEEEFLLAVMHLHRKPGYWRRRR